MRYLAIILCLLCGDCFGQYLQHRRQAWRFLSQTSDASPPTGYTFRVVASDLSLSDGDAVGTWEDQSANGWDLTQSTEANKPRFFANAIGGKPGVRYTNSSQVMQTASIGGRSLFDQYQFTIGMVIATNYNNSAGNDISFFTWYNAYGSGGGIRIVEMYYNGIYAVNDGGTYSIAFASAANGRALKPISILAVSTNASQTVYTNGISAGTDNGAINITSGTAQLISCQSASTVMDHVVCEIVVWNRELNASEISTWSNYVKAAYNIP